MTYAYLRVSTNHQDLQNQKHGIEKWCINRNIHIDEFINDHASGKIDPRNRNLGKQLELMNKNDVLICSELSRLGRSLFMIIKILEDCMNRGIKVYSIKEGYELGNNITSKVMAFAFGISAEIERDLISQRTKEALQRKRAQGYILGRTAGTYGGENALRLEEIAIKTGDGTYAYSLMKYRYLSSEFASSVNEDNTNLYLVNYDALTDEIRFRAGTFSGTTKQSVGGFNDTYTGKTPSYYATENCQVIANNSESGGSFNKDNNGGKTTVAPISGRGAGQYVDVGVATNGTGNNDVACVVWFDAYDNCLKYTYYVNPIGNWDSLKGNRTAAGWSPPKTIFAEGGEYCQIAVDKNNHIHIAAYAGNGDVKYAYLDKYDSAYSEANNSCTVDASGAVGEHLTLDVALDGSGNSIPYIGYFTSAIKAPKYAYLVDTTHANKVPEGVDDNERFTGAWEVTVVPTPSRLTSNREDKVNIGVFKTTGGVLNWSTTDGNAPAAGNIGTSESSSTSNGYSSSEASKAYGNGSKNAVFAYQISGGTGSCIETAQMR